MDGMSRMSSRSVISFRRTASDADSTGEGRRGDTFLLQEIERDEETVRHDGRRHLAIADEHRVQQLDDAVVLQEKRGSDVCNSPVSRCNTVGRRDHAKHLTRHANRIFARDASLADRQKKIDSLLVVHHLGAGFCVSAV